MPVLVKPLAPIMQSKTSITCGHREALGTSLTRVVEQQLRSTRDCLWEPRLSSEAFSCTPYRDTITRLKQIPFLPTPLLLPQSPTIIQLASTDSICRLHSRQARICAFTFVLMGTGGTGVELVNVRMTFSSFQVSRYPGF